MYTDGQYGERNPSWHEEDAEQKAWVIAEMLGSSSVNPRTIVDVGCGTGGVLLHLKRTLDAQGLTEVCYDGWDVASEPIRRARDRQGPSVRFHEGDFLASEGHADVLLCLDTVEHVADDVGFLRGLSSRADTFVFRLPLDLSALDVLRPHRMLAARKNWGHRHPYSRVLALSVLEEAGYEVGAECFHRVGGPLGGLDGIRRAAFKVAPHATVRLMGGYSLVVLATPRR